MPEMEKANQTTEKLAQEGKLEVLDGSLEVAGTDQQREEAEDAEEEEATEGVAQEIEGAEPGGAPPTRTVQLVRACIMSLYLARGVQKECRTGPKVVSSAFQARLDRAAYFSC